MIFQSPRPPVDVPRVSVTSYILERASEFSERTALVDAITDRRMTYARGWRRRSAPRRRPLAARGYGARDARIYLRTPQYRSPSTVVSWAR